MELQVIEINYTKLTISKNILGSEFILQAYYKIA